MRSGTFTVFILVVAGCGESAHEGRATVPDAGGADAGSLGPREFCPDPEHPRVHYVTNDASECVDIVLTCTTEQNGFHNQCGCGCIDKGDQLCPGVFDANITWVDIDPEKCASDPPDCPPDQTGFSNSCGCGCTSH